MSTFKQALAALALGATIAGASASAASATALVDLGTVTFDTGSNLDWLDLGQTSGFTYNQVISNTGVNFIAQGWRYATGAELGTLFDHAGGSGSYPEIDTTSTSSSTWAAVSLLANLLGSGASSSMDYQGILADP